MALKFLIKFCLSLKLCLVFKFGNNYFNWFTLNGLLIIIMG